MKERVAIFIDGSNFYHSTKKILKRDEIINYKKLIDHLVGEREFIGAFYYVALLDKSVNESVFDKHKKFIELLGRIPKFNVVLCNLKKLKIGGEVIYVIKGDDILLAHDLIMGAIDNLYDTAIIVSGDEDFYPLIKTIRDRYNKKTENAYIRSTSSYKLRKACDSSVNINKIISGIIDKRINSSSALKSTEQLTK